MNERIQELAKQAEHYADTVADQGGKFHPAYTERFARLIVQECIEVSQVGSITADKLKQHFGVGE